MTVEIRRRARFMGAVAVVATVLMGAYVWRTADSGSLWAGAVAVLLGAIAAVHAFQWWDARTPMLIADHRGIRIRLGRGWAGLEWHEIDRLEIDEPRRFGDGHVAVFADSIERRVAESDTWARINAATNRLLFDAPVVVPFGPVSTVSSDDLAEDLADLADDRCMIVLLDSEAQDEEPSVVVISDEPSNDEQDDVLVDHDVADDGDTAEETDRSTHNASLVFADLDRSRARSHWHRPDAGAAEVGDGDDVQEPEHPVAQPVVVICDDDVADAEDHDHDDSPEDAEEIPDDADAPAARSSHFGASLRSLRLPRWGRVARRSDAQPAVREVAASASWSYSEGPGGGLRVDGVSALNEGSPRRAEVTMAVTDGTSALSPRFDDQPTEPLPEVRELRRRTEDEPEPGTPEARDAGGNIGLIIDATSDMTERAMERSRPHDDVVDAEPEAPAQVERRAPRIADHDVVIGNFLRRGREALGLSVDELADRTRIRPFVIESLEVDDFSPCGGDFYVRGHLRTLSRVLDLDAAELVRRYDDLYAAPELGARQALQAERAAVGGGRAEPKGAPRWLGLAIVVLLLVLVWSLAKYVSDVTVGPAANSEAPVTSSVGVGDTAGVPVQLTATITAGDKATKVVVRSRYDEVLFSGRLKAGATQQVSGAGPLRVKASHGRTVTVTSRGTSTQVGGDDQLVLRPNRSEN